MKENKQIKKLWNKFKQSGSIEDYLVYATEKRKQKLNEENYQK